jgi:hypothetical protein
MHTFDKDEPHGSLTFVADQGIDFIVPSSFLHSAV